MAAILSLFVAFVSVAICYAETVQASEPGEHSCCAEMKHPCGAQDTGDPQPKSTQEDCCAVPAATVVALDFQAALAPSTSWVTLDPPVLLEVPQADVDTTSLDSSSPPTYLLDSVFRI